MAKRCCALAISSSILFLCGCATPPQVKQLSLQQIQYFDKAIEAVTLQSEALIIAAEKIKKEAEDKIDQTEQNNRLRFEKMATETIPKLPADKQNEVSKKMLEEVAKTAKIAESQRSKLNDDLASIKKKSLELQLYIKKMKEIHLALDAYTQSEKAGESVVKDMLNQPSVNNLLASATDLIPKIQTGVSDIKTLLNGI